MSDPRIREAIPDDAAEITRCHIGGWRTAYVGIIPQEHLDALDLEERTAARRQALLEPPWPDTANWVIEHEGRVAGWACSGASRDDDLDPAAVRELYAIYIDPDLIGHGFGRALMQHALGDAVARGAASMTMWVLTGNARGQRFYRKAGFEPDPRVAEIPHGDTGAMKLRMCRRLES